MSRLLDTDVLSEILRSAPEARVLRWFAAQRADNLFVGAVTQAEMLLGARLLPQGKRRQHLEQALGALFDQDFARRVLPYVEVVALRRQAGRTISQFDAQIAAIALQRGLALVTRNVRDFEGCGLALTDPWS